MNKIKARRMWADHSSLKYLYPHKEREPLDIPVYVIPATPEAIEQMVEQMRDGILSSDTLDGDYTMSSTPFTDAAKAALASIGIKAKEPISTKRKE